jgi:hypothetical protein
MKLKSFLFLIAALAIGLAFASCDGGSTDTVPGPTIKQGYASDVEAIEAAFEFAPNVYLTKAVTVKSGEILVIKSGNHLHLGDFKVTVQANGGIVTQDADGINWGDNGSIAGASANTAYLIGPDGAFTDKAVTDLLELEITPDNATNVVYTLVGSRYIGATTDPTKAFDANGAAKVGGGTLTVLVTPSFTVPDTHYSNAGSLAVTGNVTLAGTLAGVGGFDVYGNLTSNVVDTAAPVLVAGTLAARKITTAGGNFGVVKIKSPTETSTFGGTQTTVAGAFDATGPVEFNGEAEFSDTSTITGAATFAKAATFTGAATLNSTAGFSDTVTFSNTSAITGAATFAKAATFTGVATLNSTANFSDDVTFTADSTIGGKTVFAAGKTVTGKVAVTGQVSAGASGTNTLLLAPDGQIIYTGGVENSFLSSAGTLAALADAGTLTFSIASTELAVSGAGSLVVSSAITLDGENKIKVDGTTGVYFSATEGKIDAKTYTLGGQVGTLSTDKSANGGFILTKDGITKLVNTGSASLSYALANGANKAFLNIKQGSMATLTGVNISATGGSISFAPGATLYLAAGGSVTTTGDPAHSGYIVTTNAASGGSLVAGSLGVYAGADYITAGSVGTTGNNFIFSASKFAPNSGSASAASTKASTAPVANITATGSIGVFAAN